VLVIRRRAGESILIGDDIKIEVIEAGATRVKLGITAPRDIPVLRNEIRLAGEANRAAAREVTAAALGGLVDRLRRR
jgi:carbon storage regulator